MDTHEACEAGLPRLLGTEKQVTWAMDIRREKLTEIAELEMEYEEGMASLDRDLTAEEQVADIATRKAMMAVQHQTDATWWIDKRGDSAQQLARECS